MVLFIAFIEFSRLVIICLDIVFDFLVYYCREEEGVLTFMFEWQGQYGDPRWQY